MSINPTGNPLIFFQQCQDDLKLKSNPREILLHDFEEDMAMSYMNELYTKLNLKMCPECYSTTFLETGEKWIPKYMDYANSNYKNIDDCKKCEKCEKM